VKQKACEPIGEEDNAGSISCNLNISIGEVGDTNIHALSVARSFGGSRHIEHCSVAAVAAAADDERPDGLRFIANVMLQL
jgi:hypothetical protein